MKLASNLALLAVPMVLAGSANAATIVLYDQDFEAPKAYNNDGGDVNPYSTVNDNYGGQPPGFQFGQVFTVETLNITGSDRDGGTAAFGTGWSDPDGTGGDFAIGMLSDAQDDRLGLSFSVGALPFLNFGLDVSSIDLSTFGGPFVPIDGLAPVFQFTPFDNPSGAVGIGGGTILDQKTLTGTASPRDVFDWTSGVFAFKTAGNTNGNVTLQIDLLVGGYAAMDNFRITASDDEGDLGGGPTPVPLPASLPLMAFGVALLAGIRRRRG
jgi:hypothetical protein